MPNTTIKTTVKGIGHITFEQNGQPITALNLKPNSVGTVSLKNTGGVDITDAKVSDLNEAGFTNVNCPTDAKGTLPTGAACTFTYQISSTPKANTFTIIANGKDADNSPVNLPITVSTAGHFVFEKNGKAITALTLEPNATGTISLKNTGGVDITDAKVSDLNEAGFTNVNCPTDAKGILPTGAACTFTYQISSTPKANTFTIIANGKDADNSPQNLSIHTSNGMNIRVYNDWSGWDPTHFNVHCNSKVKNIWTGSSAIFEDTICSPLILDLGSPWPGNYKVDTTENAEKNCLAQHKYRLVYNVHR